MDSANKSSFLSNCRKEKVIYAETIAEMWVQQEPQEAQCCLGASHHIMDENLHPLVAVQWWSKPRDHALFSSTEGAHP